MPLLHIAAVIIVIGVLMGLINKFMVMQPPYKDLLNTVVIIAVVLWVLAYFLPIGNYVNTHLLHV